MLNRFSRYGLVVVAALAALGGCADDERLAAATGTGSHAETPMVSDANGPLAPLDAVRIDNPARVQLGRLLFHDVRLSRDDTLSCASCHDIASGGDDGRVTAVGVGGAVGPINTPTVLNAVYNLAQFWDGRADTLADQVPQPVHNPVEMGSNWSQVVGKLLADEDLVARFRKAYPDGLTVDNVIDAIATYEAALVTPDSPFDRYLRGERDALSAQAAEGYRLFVDLGCVACHQGRNVGGNMYQHFGVMGDYFADRGNVTTADFGRYNVTGRESDRFLFKVPSLRNVADTAPYFHDGSAATLHDAVAIMARYQLGRPIAEREVDAIVAFLRSLSGSVDRRLL